jgi:hypothetical protein
MTTYLMSLDLPELTRAEARRIATRVRREYALACTDVQASAVVTAMHAARVAKRDAATTSAARGN